MTITNQPPPGGRRGRGGNAPPTTRLPSSRERRPALAALAVLLIAGGAVLAGWLALRQSQTESYLVVDQTIHYGDQIERGDLRTIELPADSGDFILASQRNEVIDSYARVELVPNTVLAGGMYGDAPELAGDQDIVGLNLDPSQYPKTLKPGDSVVVVRSDQDGNPLRLTGGTVRGARASDTGDGSVLDVVMSNRCSAEFATSSSLGDVEVVEVAPNARTIVCASPGEVAKLPKESP